MQLHPLEKVLGKIWANFVRFGRNLGEFEQNIGKFRQNLGKFGQK